MLKKIAKEIISHILVYSGMAMLFYRLKIRKCPNRFRILVYHRVNNQRHIRNPVAKAMSISVRRFERQLKFLQKYFNIVSLDSITNALGQKKALPRHSLAITLDDGYRDNYLYAFPLLKKYKLPATIFLTTGYLGKQSNLWWDTLHQITAMSESKELWQFCERRLNIKFRGVRRTRYLQLVDYLKSIDISARDQFIGELKSQFQIIKGKDDLRAELLAPAEVKEMSAAGISFGSHTVSHLIVSKSDEQLVKQELIQSKKEIEEITGRDVFAFAYPNGAADDFDEKSIELLQECGYELALTNIGGINSIADNQFTLKRIGVYGNDSMAAFICRCFGLF
ncbi:polysaccharide deacetylase family protein [candidate division KSB1 bacterium]|nr:polysaccharide deacetylase family protein [candidate division KSB1 bacterium]